MDKQNSKSTTQETDQQITDKKTLFIGGFIVLFIAICPFIFYSYTSFPDNTKIWETSFFKLNTSFFSWFDYAWYLSNKIVPLYLFLIWFFTCKHWWHWIILVPISMYSFQLLGLINQNSNPDEIELYYVLPLMMVIVPFVYVIRAKLFDKIRGDDLEAFERELGQKRNVWQQILDLFG